MVDTASRSRTALRLFPTYTHASPAATGEACPARLCMNPALNTSIEGLVNEERVEGTSGLANLAGDCEWKGSPHLARPKSVKLNARAGMRFCSSGLSRSWRRTWTAHETCLVRVCLCRYLSIFRYNSSIHIYITHIFLLYPTYAYICVYIYIIHITSERWCVYAYVAYPVLVLHRH